MRLLRNSRTADFGIDPDLAMLGGSIAGGIIGSTAGLMSGNKRVLQAGDAYHPMAEQRYKQYERTGKMPDYTAEQQLIADEYKEANADHFRRFLGGHLAGTVAGGALGLGLAAKWGRR